MKIRVQKQELVVTPVEETELTLDALVDRITPENSHGEVTTGAAVGCEI